MLSLTQLSNFIQLGGYTSNFINLSEYPYFCDFLISLISTVVFFPILVSQ